MALAHSRKVIVGGVPYEWVISPTGPRPRLGVNDHPWSPLQLRLVVQGRAGKMCCVLHSKNQNEWHEAFLKDENERNPGHLATLGPGDVATTIRFALEHGWDDTKSGTFTSEPPPNLNDYGPKGSKRDTMCGCGRALSQSYHGCPYKQAVGAAGREIGESSLCKCCEVCTHNCYMNS